MAISHWYWHVVFKNGNFTLLLTPSGQEWQFHISYWHLMVIKNDNITLCYWHLVVKNKNFTLLLISSGQEWQFHIANEIYCWRIKMSHYYWHLVIKNGNFILHSNVIRMLECHSSGQEWQFHIATDILVITNLNFHINTDI